MSARTPRRGRQAGRHLVFVLFLPALFGVGRLARLSPSSGPAPHGRGRWASARLPPARSPPIAAALPVVPSRAAHHRVSAGCPRARPVEKPEPGSPNGDARRPLPAQAEGDEVVIAAVVRPVLGARTFSR